MKVHPAWLILPALVFGNATSARETPGTIAGSIRYTGKVPAPKKVETNDGPLLHDDLVVDDKTRGLRHVAAILEDAPAQPRVKKSEPVVVDQRERVFVPRVVVVRHGQAVRFDNSDAANHGVMASSIVKANQFNMLTPPNQSYEHTFEPHKHPVQIGCPLHAWMRAWVFVVSHPWFAVSDTRGEFRIKDVPPGKYTLLLRHPDTGHQERRPVAVKAGLTTEITIAWKKVGDQ